MSADHDDFSDGLMILLLVLSAPVWGLVWVPAWITGRIARAIREHRTLKDTRP